VPGGEAGVARVGSESPSLSQVDAVTSFTEWLEECEWFGKAGVARVGGESWGAGARGAPRVMAWMGKRDSMERARSSDLTFGGRHGTTHTVESTARTASDVCQVLGRCRVGAGDVGWKAARAGPGARWKGGRKGRLRHRAGPPHCEVPRADMPYPRP
jgi:hypothetical protein